MREETIEKILVLSFMTMLFVSLGGISLAGDDVYTLSSEISVDPNDHEITEYEVRDPIRIDGDENFDKQATEEGWPGDGTEDAPYIIQGYEIDGTGAGSCIYIGNTTVYFVVRDNYVHSASGNIGQFFWNSGLVLRNVENGRLIDNIATGNGRHGIYLTRDSMYNILQGNQANENDRHGIFLDDYSDHNHILNNTADSNNQGVLSNDHGIFLTDSSNNLISGNEISNNYNGIRTSGSCHNNIFTKNNISGNSLQGILLVSSNNNIISWNTISNNGGTGGSGVRLFNSDNNEVYGNNMVDNNDPQGFDDGTGNVWNTDYPKGGNYWSDYTGVDEYRGPDQDIEGPDGIGDSPYNDVDGGVDEYPLMLPTIDGRIQRPPIRIDDNTEFISANGVSSGSGFVHDPYVIEDWKIDAAGLGCGIYVGNTTMYFVIRNNFIHDAGGNLGGEYHRDTGIYLWNAENGILFDNILDNNDSGVRLTDARDNTVEYNEITGRRTGIALRRSSTGNSIIGNNVTGQALTAIIFYDSDENQLIENEIMNNRRGIHFDNSNHNDIMENSMDNNDEYSIYFYQTCSNNSIVWNTISNSDHGIYMQEYSQDNTVDGNTITSTVVQSIYLYRSSRNIIQLNTISSNSGNGIWIYDSSNENLLRYNTITDNLGLGIAAISSHFNFIGFNNVSKNEGGISLLSSNDNIILDNTASSNTIDHGLYLLSSHRNSISENTVNSNNQTGIYLSSSLYNTLEDNTALLNQDNGIWLNLSHDNEILENDLRGNYHGIYVLDSDRNELSNNSIFDSSQYGVFLERSEDNDILDNIAVDNMVGLVLWYSDYGTISGNTLTDNGWYGIIINNSNNNTISDNKASQNAHGLFSYNCNDNHIEGNILSNNTGGDGAGIIFQLTSRNTIIGNDISSNTNYGIFFIEHSHANLIEGNTIHHNGNYGISIWGSNDTQILENTIVNNTNFGIFTRGSSHHSVIEENTIEGHRFGIYVLASVENIISGNTMVDNGLMVAGGQLEYWNTHEIDTDNTVNGKPVQYWKDQTGGTIPAGAGQVILANCDGVTVEDQDVSSGTVGISAGFSEDITITGNDADHNGYIGIYLFRVDNSVIMDNQASNTYYGIYLLGSSWNTIQENTAKDNVRMPGYPDPGTGIFAVGSHNNTIADNTVEENEYGVQITQNSHHNHLVRNNMDNNIERGLDVRYSDENIIEANTVSGNSLGINLQNTKGNTVDSNTISNNQDFGIRVAVSDENIITGNTIMDNEHYGLYIGVWSYSNLIYRNKFIGNSNHSYDHESVNYWNHTDPAEGGFGGNYWDDYEEHGIVDRGDGVGTPGYEIPEGGNYDHYPWVNPYMVTWAHGFSVSVDDMIAGEQPVVMIYDARDEHDFLLNGVYSAIIEIDGTDVTTDLTFSDGESEYIWYPIIERGSYTVEVTIDGVLDSYDFFVHSGDAGEFDVSVDEITAGQQPVITIDDAEDGHGNLLSGEYTVTIEIDDTEISVDLDFDMGYTSHTWDAITAADEYVAEVTIDGVMRSDSFDVVPADAHTIIISPTDVQTITAGEELEFSAEALDEYGNLITDVVTDFEWHGTDSNGVFYEEVADDYEVSASYGTVMSDVTHVIVEPGDVHTVLISPTDVQTITAGGELEFSAEALDEYGNLITDVVTDFDWNGADSNGVFSEEVASSYQVSAVYEEITSDIVTVIVTHGTTHSVIIEPYPEAEVEAGVNLQFTAEAYDEYGNLITDTIRDFSWEGADVNGIFNEDTSGEYHVTAAYDGVSSEQTTVTVIEEDDVIFTLTIGKVGEGNTDPSVGTHNYDEGTMVVIEAISAEGWVFSHWAGDHPVDEREEASIEIIMDSNKELTAYFIEEDIDAPPDDDDDESGIMDLLSDYWWILLALIIIIVIAVLLVLMRGKKGQPTDEPYTEQPYEEQYQEEPMEQQQYQEPYPEQPQEPVDEFEQPPPEDEL